jgi:hypothetical protein
LSHGLAAKTIIEIKPTTICATGSVKSVSLSKEKDLSLLHLGQVVFAATAQAT